MGTEEKYEGYSEEAKKKLKERDEYWEEVRKRLASFKKKRDKYDPMKDGPIIL